MNCRPPPRNLNQDMPMASRDLDRLDRRIRHGVWVLAVICLVLAVVVWGRFLGVLPY